MAPGKRGALPDEPKSPAKRVARPIPDIGSPLKRVKAAIRQREIAREDVVLSTVEEFRAYVKDEPSPPNPDVNVVVTGTVIWKSAHKFNERDLVRIHMTDAVPAESTEELAEFEVLYNSSNENRNLVETVLLTVTVFGEPIDSSLLPADGTVVRIKNSRQRLLYMGEKCQLVARAMDITVMTDAN